MADVVDGYEFAKNILQKHEDSWRGTDKTKAFTQSGAMRSILDVGSEKYYSYRVSIGHIRVPKWREDALIELASLQ